MKNSNRAGSQSDDKAVRIISGIFRLRKDLVSAVKRRVLAGSGLDIEEADLLLEVYGAVHLGWQTPKADEQGYVTFQDLQSSLAHSPTLLSRRVALLKSRGWLDSCQLHALKAYHGKVDKKAKAARITAAGIKIIEPVYEKYCRFCDEMISAIPRDSQQSLQSLIESLLKKVRGEL